MADKTNNQLQVILQEQNVPAEQAKQMVELFGGPFEEAGQILATYKDIKVTDINDVEGMQQARTKRLALKAARTTVERNRKQLKENIVKQGRAIDSVAKFVKDTIAPAEEYLQLQEDFAKLEAKRQHEAMLAERREQLIKLGADPELYNYKELPNAAFEQLLFDINRENERVAEEAKKAEAERKAKADAEAAEQARKDLEAKRVRSLMVLGFNANDEGVLTRKGYDTGLVEAELLQLDDKPFDDKVNEAIKATDEQAAKDAEARKAEQARQQKITDRVNWLSSLGAVFNGTDYRLASKLPGGEGAVVSKHEVENDSDEAFAKALQIVENVAKANGEYDEQQQAEAQAARDRAAKLEQEKRDREAADAKAKAAAEEAERAALLAPDKTKLTTFADALEMIRTTKLPAVKTKQAQDVVNMIDAELTRLHKTVIAQANRLK